METFSALLAICAGNSPVPGEFPTKRPVTRNFDVFFDLRPNKLLSKQSWGWWFETPSHYYDVIVMPGSRLNIKHRFTSIGTAVIKIRRSQDRLIPILGNPIPGKTTFILRVGPDYCRSAQRYDDNCYGDLSYVSTGYNEFTLCGWGIVELPFISYLMVQRCMYLVSFSGRSVMMAHWYVPSIDWAVEICACFWAHILLSKL